MRTSCGSWNKLPQSNTWDYQNNQPCLSIILAMCDFEDKIYFGDLPRFIRSHCLNIHVFLCIVSTSINYREESRDKRGCETENV